MYPFLVDLIFPYIEQECVVKCMLRLSVCSKHLHWSVANSTHGRRVCKQIAISKKNPINIFKYKYTLVLYACKHHLCTYEIHELWNIIKYISKHLRDVKFNKIVQSILYNSEDNIHTMIMFSRFLKNPIFHNYTLVNDYAGIEADKYVKHWMGKNRNLVEKFIIGNLGVLTLMSFSHYGYLPGYKQFLNAQCKRTGLPDTTLGAPFVVSMDIVESRLLRYFKRNGIVYENTGTFIRDYLEGTVDWNVVSSKYTSFTTNTIIYFHVLNDVKCKRTPQELAKLCDLTSHAILPYLSEDVIILLFEHIPIYRIHILDTVNRKILKVLLNTFPHLALEYVNNTRSHKMHGILTNILVTTGNIPGEPLVVTNRNYYYIMLRTGYPKHLLIPKFENCTKSLLWTIFKK